MAKEATSWIQMVSSAIGGALGWYFGSIDGIFYAQIVVCILDWIIGSLRYCLADKSISSRFVFRKAGEKLMIFVLVGIANVLDSEILGAGQVLRDAVIFFYISGEVVAIQEHAGQLGLPIPRKFTRILDELREKGDDENRDEK